LLGSHDEEIRLATGINFSIFMILVDLCILIMAKTIFNKRRINKYELYEIHYKKKGN
jgi:hypothetical protein